MTARKIPRDGLLTPAEVAAMLRVDPKTVTRWAAQGKLASIRTPGGHRRYSEAEVRGYLTAWTKATRTPGTAGTAGS